MRARVANVMGRYAAVRRRACNLRQIDLARRLGVSRQWVIGFERGRPGLDLDLTLRAFEALGLGLDMVAVEEQAPAWIAEMKSSRELDALRRERRPRLRRSREYLDQLHIRAEMQLIAQRQQAEAERRAAEAESAAAGARKASRRKAEG